MSYVDEILLTGESVIYRTRLHWIVYGWAFFFLVVGLCLLPLGFDGVRVGVVSIFVSSVAGVAAWLARLTAEFVVTNRRVIVKVGVVRRRTEEMLLQKVEQLKVNQGIVARMLGYGTIQLTGTGGSGEYFKRVANPLELSRQVFEQVEADRLPGDNRAPSIPG